jgi:ubiquinone/menaquinone biosynthesis C-methylase UbiE
MSTDIYNKKAHMYDDFRNPAAGWDECKKLLDVKNTDTILDLGCGSGEFLFRLLDLSPKTLHGCDLSNDMLDKAREKLEKNKDKSKVELFNCSTQELESRKYDKILCCQVIQNLSYQKENLINIRKDFYQEIYRLLKPGGKLVIATRFYSLKEGYNSMYWYADKNFLTKSIKDMEDFVPANLSEELKSSGFINTSNLISKDLLYKKDWYFKYDYLDKVNWQAADSFWSHVKRNQELENYINFLKSKNEDQIKKYIVERDKLRNNRGHILVVSANK